MSKSRKRTGRRRKGMKMRKRRTKETGEDEKEYGWSEISFWVLDQYVSWTMCEGWNLLGRDA